MSCLQLEHYYAKTTVLSILFKKLRLNEMLPAKYGMLVIEMLTRTKRYKTK